MRIFVDRNLVMLGGDVLHHDVVVHLRFEIVGEGHFIYTIRFILFLRAERDDSHGSVRRVLGRRRLQEEVAHLLKIENGLAAFFLTGSRK